MVSLVAVCVVAVCAMAGGGARELDPAACAARFDVQRDKIIRTEESREMGARYLAELDVGARTECRRLCCETDACDVFVYEEQSPGSCYLFNCGPPEDFRCKFTAHGNFSSGVLALSRHLAELQDQERLAPHPPASRAPPAPPPAHTAPPQPTRSARCSRYQFECHSGGECIAVYNACDGVPQCADGSDEAPELGCPAPAPAPHTAPTTTPAPTAAPTPPARPPAQERGAGVGGEGDGRDGGAAGPAGAGGERWPHRLAQAQPRRYTESSAPAAAPHIFSHKGGLVQDAGGSGGGGGAQQYAAFEPPWARRPWPPRAPGAESGAWGPWGEWGAPRGGGEWGAGEWAAPGRQAWPVGGRAELPPPPAAEGPNTIPELAEQYAAVGEGQVLRDAPKKGLGLLLPAATPTPATPPPPPARPPPLAQPAPTHTAQHLPPQHLQHGVGSAEARAAEAGAGRSERPPAAVVLLVLGVMMTCVVAGLSWCGARGARCGGRGVRGARGARGRAGLAHDADYLVNGMYL